MSLGNVVDLRDKPPRFLGNPKLPLKPEKRIPLRSRRRRVRALIAIITFLCIAASLWAFSAITYADRFSIAAIGVANHKDVSAYDVFNYVQGVIHDGKWHYLSRNSIFFYPKKEISEGILQNFPRVESVTISKEHILSTQVTISITERTPLMRWCGESLCYQMDKGGYIFAQADASHQSLIEFNGGIATSSPIGTRIAEQPFKKAVDTLELLTSAGFHPTRVAIQDSEDYFVYLDEGFYIKATFGAEGQLLIKNLQLILTSDALNGKEKRIEYVDLRFGNRVYYKLKGETGERS